MLLGLPTDRQFLALAHYRLGPLFLFLACLAAPLFRQLQPTNGLPGRVVPGSLAWWAAPARRFINNTRGAAG